MAVWPPLAYVCLHGCLASTGPCMPSWLFGLHWPMYAFMAVWPPLAYVCLHGCLASTGLCMPSWLFGLHWPMYASMAVWPPLAYVFVFIASSFLFQGAAPLRFDYG